MGVETIPPVRLPRYSATWLEEVSSPICCDVSAGFAQKIRKGVRVVFIAPIEAR
jgi:hypothetical protein